jgi:hypothetical protein
VFSLPKVGCCCYFSKNCKMVPLPLPVQAAAGTQVVLELGDVAGSWVTGSARRRHRKFGPALYCLDALDSYQDDVKVGPGLSRGGAGWCEVQCMEQIVTIGTCLHL